MTKYTLDEVNDMYVDVLKEIGNVGSGNAATAIANMVGTRIDMKVPNVKLMDVGKLGSAIGPEEETVIGIFLEVSHDIDGSMMFLLDLESGHYLADKLLMKENVVHEQMEVFDEMELSKGSLPLTADKCATAARSQTSCTDDDASMTQPVWRTAQTSWWSPKMLSDCAASARALTCRTPGRSSPAIL